MRAGSSGNDRINLARCISDDKIGRTCIRRLRKDKEQAQENEIQPFVKYSDRNSFLWVS